ncbi:MAG TPA: TonB-dependent receptor [Holophagaceae bacterium]|nr:TonB-dependent receptor [Holophagaceae bacterium]
MHLTPGLRSSFLGGAALLGTAVPAAALPSEAQQVPKPKPTTLADLSLEDLSRIEVTSVSKRPEKLSETAAAVYVITSEDIRRSGADSIPEALRLAPNLEVARIGASQYAISARGFDSGTSNKLLVLIDGRSVYTPLYSGMFWDAQDVVLQDVDRIEVISGPGGTLWGSNAVNGVINIITRRAGDTEGLLLRAGAGSEERALATVRYGVRLSETAAFRVYGKFTNRDATVREASGADAMDGWHMAQGGFRLDWSRDADAMTVQGDSYSGALHQPTLQDQTLAGTNLLGRWSHAWSKDSDLQVQFYYDRTERISPGVFGEDLDTLDLDLQHRYRISARQQLIWGGGGRFMQDDVRNSASLAFLPAHKDLRLYNLFGQYDVDLVPERLDLALGAKLEHNVYTGWEFQPSGRLSWKITESQLLWTAVSRAVRTPSRLDRELFAPGNPPYLLAGGPDFRSESVVAYELGYKVQTTARLSFSASSFYNVYKHLRTLEPSAGGMPYVIANQMEGETYGGEVWADLVLTDHWRLKPGYAYLHKDLRLLPGSQSPNGVQTEGNDPEHRFTLSSILNVGAHVELDGTIRHVSALPAPEVPGYTTLDVHLAWRPTEAWEIALIGQNLFDRRHPEFGAGATRDDLERSAMLRVTWTF